MTRRMTDERRRLDELVLGDVGLKTPCPGPTVGWPRRPAPGGSARGSADFPAWVSAPSSIRMPRRPDVLDDPIAAPGRGAVARRQAASLPADDPTRIYAAECLAEGLRWSALALRRCWAAGSGWPGRPPAQLRWRFAVLQRSRPLGAAGEFADRLLEQPPAGSGRARRAGIGRAAAAQAGLDDLC
jgi:hypothetical protein